MAATATDIALSILYIVTLFYTIFWLIALLDEKPEKKLKLRKCPFVTVAVPAYNEEPTIRETLDSIWNLNYPKNRLEVIVVNDGSTDKTEEAAEKYIKEHPGFNISLITQENSGKWVAVNQALEKSKGEFFACLDADSAIEENALSKMLPHFSNTGVGAVLPLLKIKDPKSFLQKIQWYEYLINMFYKKLLSYLNCIHVTPGPFSLYRKEAIKSLGGFRPGHKTEDLEMAMRLQKNNYQIIQLLDAEVYTYPPNDIVSLYLQRKRWNRGSVLNIWDYKKMLFNKKYGDFGAFQLPIILSAGFMALAIVLLILYQNLFKPLLNALHNFTLINFDILTFIRNFKLDFILLDMNYYRLVIIIMMFSISLLVFVLAHRYTQERITKHGMWSLMAFLFLYYVFLGLVWGGVAADLILKRKGRW